MWRDPINQAAFFMVLALPLDDTFYIFVSTYPVPPEYAAQEGLTKVVAVVFALIINFFLYRAFLRKKLGVVV